MKKMKYWAILFTLAILSFSIPKFALAAQEGIQISPLTYKFDIKPGETQSAKITVKNLNNTPLDYTTEAEIFSSVSDDGAPSFAAETKEAGLNTLADWIVFTNDSTGTIPVGGTKVINFTITVPANAEPGGHYAAVFAKQSTPTAEGQTEIGVASRVGTLVLVTVPGEVIKSSAITEFKSPSFVIGGPVSFDMKVKNSGSVHFDSNAKVELKPIFGKTTTVDLGTHTIIPANSRNFVGEWSYKYPFGRYAITATATDIDGKLMTTTAILWAIPLVIVIPAIFVIILLILLIVYMKKHLKFVSNEQIQ
ncbi:MAG: hypothetical protein WCO23_00965 [bacterium]